MYEVKNLSGHRARAGQRCCNTETASQTKKFVILTGRPLSGGRYHNNKTRTLKSWDTLLIYCETKRPVTILAREYTKFEVKSKLSKWDESYKKRLPITSFIIIINYIFRQGENKHHVKRILLKLVWKQMPKQKFGNTEKALTSISNKMPAHCLLSH